MAVSISGDHYVFGHDFINDAKYLLSNNDFIQYCSDKEKEILFKNLKIKKYFDNQNIYIKGQQCEEVFLVVEGTIKIGWYTQNHSFIFYHIAKKMKKNSLLNFTYLIGSGEIEHDYIARGRVIIATISKNILFEILKNNNEVQYVLLSVICNNFCALIQNEYFRAILPLRVRLAKRLVLLYEMSENGDQQIKTSFSQEDISELLQSYRQIISKELDWFKKQGIVELKYKKINILNLEKLYEIANEIDV
ncbi:MAG: Crp/Fnr family transcriptional regulator [Acinetobacter populi]|jgi:CRP-like cAMP-binding protein|uniref:Crp/Fnr family transcriptional regulator n=1 Tax=Acinetobacter populi TaxID=1582270 RepID=UPI00235793F1|nr:Crp/Fnr family transcriptional regulator [Acinetobacter populi]MCH4247178.1 Crp/Fnr family transcriptional regulator [Acinetobacter populi]